MVLMISGDKHQEVLALILAPWHHGTIMAQQVKQELEIIQRLWEGGFQLLL